MDYERLFNVDYQDVQSESKQMGMINYNIFEERLSKLRYPIILGNLTMLTRIASAYFRNDYDLKKKIVDLLAITTFSENKTEINTFLKNLNRIDLKRGIFNLYGIEIPIKICNTKKDELLILHDSFDESNFYWFLS